MEFDSNVSSPLTNGGIYPQVFAISDGEVLCQLKMDLTLLPPIMESSDPCATNCKKITDCFPRVFFPTLLNDDLKRDASVAPVTEYCSLTLTLVVTIVPKGTDPPIVNLPI